MLRSANSIYLRLPTLCEPGHQVYQLVEADSSSYAAKVNFVRIASFQDMP